MDAEKEAGEYSENQSKKESPSTCSYICAWLELSSSIGLLVESASSLIQLGYAGADSGSLEKTIIRAN